MISPTKKKSPPKKALSATPAIRDDELYERDLPVVNKNVNQTLVKIAIQRLGMPHQLFKYASLPAPFIMFTVVYH